ncbi:MAG: hypothetical protein AAB417_01425 [Patescibacteria group bacterium]
MSKKIFTHAAVLAIALMPLIVAAQAQGGDIKGFITGTLGGIVGALINFLIAVATLVFIFGVIRYIAAGGDAEKVKEARSYIIFAIVGLAAILGIWGIARLLATGIGGSDTNIPTLTI